jgi:hypothetical protein
MNIKEANKIICDFVEDNSCMCMVNSICPSPSSHHNFCINPECKKEITETSYKPYALSLDSLSIAWKQFNNDFSIYDGLKISTTINENETVVQISTSLDLENGGFQLECETGTSIQKTYCIATAKAILKAQES